MIFKICCKLNWWFYRKVKKSGKWHEEFRVRIYHRKLGLVAGRQKEKAKADLLYDKASIRIKICPKKFLYAPITHMRCKNYKSVRGCWFTRHYRLIFFELKVIHETGVEYFTFVSSRLRIICGNNDQIHNLKDTLEF